MGIIEYLLICILVVAIIAVACIVYFISKRNKESLETLTEYVKAQKEQAEAEQRIKELRKEEMKSKLETFKQTKDELKEKLKNQIDAKEWKPLDAILSNADKGTVGIYIIYNETKNKYYVGQAKQIIQRIKAHFQVEEMAKDFMTGDKMSVKFLTANELGNDYRLDHVEKTGIEILNSDKDGYNKTRGNL